MNWKYETYIVEQLLSLQSEMNLSEFSFEVETEQMFVKRKDYDSNTIYIVIKYLADSKSIGAVQQPVQMLILSEQNSLDIAKALFDKFASDYNWKVVIQDGEYIKQQYTSPVVLSNFNPVLYGYRSVMYMTANLFVMSNIIDFRKITIDDLEIEPLNFGLSYSMTPNTQQTTVEEIASSVKNVSTISFAITVAMQNNTFVNKILNIIGETASGNDSFEIKLYVDKDSDTPTITKTVKLISAQITTAVNQIPGIQVGLMK